MRFPIKPHTFLHQHDLTGEHIMQTLNAKLTAHQLITIDMCLAAKLSDLRANLDEYRSNGNNPDGETPYRNRIADIEATRKAINHALNGGE